MLLSAPTLTALMLWASALSGLPADPSRLPSIEYSYDIPKGIGAWTDRHDGNIEVNANIDWSSIDFTCTVVHELVHHLQWQSGHMGLSTEVEPPAYTTAAKCYSAYGDRAGYYWAMWQAEEHSK